MALTVAKGLDERQEAGLYSFLLGSKRVKTPSWNVARSLEHFSILEPLKRSEHVPSSGANSGENDVRVQTWRSVVASSLVNGIP